MCVTSTIFAVIAGLSIALNAYLIAKPKDNKQETTSNDEFYVDEIDISVYESK